MEPGKVLCCRFLFAILGVDRAKTWQNEIGYVCLCNMPIETLRLRNSCIVHE